MTASKTIGRAAGLCGTTACALAALALFGATAAHAAPQLTMPVNDALRVEVPGNIRPELKTAHDLGRIDDSELLQHVYLRLKRAPEKQAALNAYMATLFTKGSANYHKWINPDQMEAEYGVDPHDLAVVTAWLESKGIKVNANLKSLVLDVDATAGQLREAFGVELHHVMGADGRRHMANINNPKVPVALRPVLEGPVTLNDYFPHPMMKHVRPPAVPVSKGRGNYTIAGGYELVAPADLQTIYNITPVYQQGYTGAGMTVGLIEDTNLYTTGDWYAFRKVFGLSREYPQGTLSVVTPNCTVGINSASGEAALDVEWASAAAPNAAIKMYACADTRTNFGGFVAMANMYSANSFPSILSISYGEAETASGATLNATVNTLYQEYAAAGVALFVSSGDAVAAAYDRNSSGTAADHGVTVTGWGETNYNVSVGGTDFADSYLNTTGSYWNTSNTPNFGSAMSYIPEIPWNSTCSSGLLVNNYWNAQAAAGGSLTQAQWTGSISGTTMTVTAIAPGSNYVYTGLTITGAGVASGTTITRDLSGTAGGIGTYQVSTSQTVPSTTLTGAVKMASDSAVGLCSITYFEDIYAWEEPVGGSGGPSGCATGTYATGETGVVSGTCKGYTKPSWQTVYGNPSDGVRDIPDVSLFASDGVWGHYYPFCYSDPTSGYGGATCTDSPSSWAGAGGTSFASPIMAGIQALVNQKNGNSGLPTPTYYAIARGEYGTTAAASGTTSCNSEAGSSASVAGSGPASSCVFNNVQLGDISAICKLDGRTAYGCYIASGATLGVLSTSTASLQPATTGAYGTSPGWNFSTGLGSVNVYNLVNSTAW